MPVALILVDALAARYAKQLPSLRKISDGGFAGSMRNIYAYRGIEATLFTGRPPSVHGVWGEFRPNSLPELGGIRERAARSLIRMGDLLPSDRLRLDVRYVAAKLQRTKHLATGNLIPAAMIPYFRSSLETDIWSQDAMRLPTLFDEIRTAAGSFETVVYPTIRTDPEVPAWVKDRVQRRNLPDYWYIKFSALDALGHKYGPHSVGMLPALRALDAQLAEVTSILAAAYGERINIVVLGDHGMSAVKHNMDVRPILQGSRLAPGRDYLYFLDSTTIRFWSHSEAVLARLRHAFEGVAGMQVLNAQDRAALDIPDDASTGDLLVALDEGSVVFPDFFRRTGAPLGMHGYARVLTDAGLPFMAADRVIASGLEVASGKLPGHADVYAAMRSALGLTPAVQQPELETPMEVA